MKVTIGVALTIVGIVAVVLLIGAVRCQLDDVCRAEEQHEAQLRITQATELAPLNLWVERSWRAALIAVAVALALAALALVPAAWTYLPAKAKIAAAVAWSHFGLPPWTIQAADNGRLVVSGPGANASFSDAAKARALMAGAEQLKVGAPGAMVGSAEVPRLTAGVARQLLNPKPDEAILTSEPETPVLTLADATRVDPKVNPHWLMIGKTGSGKSNAMRHVLTLMAQRYPSEFVICEPQRGNWKDDAHAWSVFGIAEAVNVVYTEQARRAELLAAHPTAEHVLDLPDVRLSYLCLIFAEMDATMDNLYRLDRAQHKQTLVQLRDIARMGRKQGICLFAESQSGLADILDSNIARNFANIFLFNGSQQTAKNLGVSDLVSLPRLPLGMAFSMTHEATVEFPPIARPALRRSQLYQEPEILQLPADAEADGLGANDLPDGTIPVYRNTEPQNGHFSSIITGIPVHVPLDVPPSDAAHKRHIYRRYLALGSLKATEREIYHQEGGVKFYWVRDVVNEELARRRRPQLNEE